MDAVFSQSTGSATRRRSSLAVGMCAAMIGLTGCGGAGPFRAQISTLTAASIPTRQIPGEVRAEVDGFPDVDWCSHAHDIYDFCIDGANSGLRDGLARLLSGYGLTPGEGGYRAVLRVSDFTHGYSNPISASMSVSWQFVLFDPAGSPILQLSERTSAPEAISGRPDFEPAARRMLDAVLERIAVAMNDLTISPSEASSSHGAETQSGVPAGQ